MNPALTRWTRDPDLDAKLDALEPGKRYLIIWTNDSRRTDRMSVLKFLGHNSVARQNDDTSWDARPDAGTQNMPRSWILHVHKASPIAKVRIDEKAPVPGTYTNSKPDNDAVGAELVWIACGNTDPHAEHAMPADGPGRDCRCPGIEDLMPGVRWQAQMEEHLHEVRTLTAESMRLSQVSGWADNERGRQNMRVRVELAKANATAALTLAVANGLGDLEPLLRALAGTEEDTLLNPPVPFSPRWHAQRKAGQ
jgi:hypothetical protein